MWVISLIPSADAEDASAVRGLWLTEVNVMPFPSYAVELHSGSTHLDVKAHHIRLLEGHHRLRRAHTHHTRIHLHDVNRVGI